MTEHRLKTQEQNFLAIASGQRRIDPRLADRNFAQGDKVTFVRHARETEVEGEEATVTLTHVAQFGPELFTDDAIASLTGRYMLLGLSRPTEPVLIPPAGAVALKTWPAYFKAIEAGNRVDLRAEKFWHPSGNRVFKLGTAILYQEYSPEFIAYSGKVTARQVKQVTPWSPKDHYTREQIYKHGISVLGWKGLEQKVK